MDYADGKCRVCNYIYFPVGVNLGNSEGLPDDPYKQTRA